MDFFKSQNPRARRRILVGLAAEPASFSASHMAFFLFKEQRFLLPQSPTCSLQLSNPQPFATLKAAVPHH